MVSETLKGVLMRRDGMLEDEADDYISRAQDEFNERLEAGEMPFDFMEDEFGLEPDYLVDFIHNLM